MATATCSPYDLVIKFSLRGNRRELGGNYRAYLFSVTGCVYQSLIFTKCIRRGHRVNAMLDKATRLTAEARVLKLLLPELRSFL